MWSNALKLIVHNFSFFFCHANLAEMVVKRTKTVFFSIGAQKKNQVG